MVSSGVVDHGFVTLSGQTLGCGRSWVRDPVGSNLRCGRSWVRDPVGSNLGCGRSWVHDPVGSNPRVR